MSHFEEKYCDPQVKDKKKNAKIMSLLDFVGDPKREDSLVGLQYVVEIKMLDSDKTVVKCNLCNVKGQLATMKQHLLGSNHITLYMEKHYFSVLDSLRKTTVHKSQLGKLLKDYAKEIERAEGTQTIKIEYVSAGDMKKEQENWITEQEERLECHAEQKKFQVLDRRQLALRYSEKFKISSREEATIVLNLTQQLSDQLEKHFLKYKALNVLDSAMPDSISTKTTPALINYPPNSHENLHPKSATNQGLSIAKEMPWHTEEPSSSSVCPPASVHSSDRVSVKLTDTWGMKHKLEVSKDDDNECNGLQQRKSSPGSSIAKEMPWHTEKQSSSSVCPRARVLSSDRESVEMKDTWGMKRKLEVSKYDYNECDGLQQRRSAPEFQSRNKRPHKELDKIPTKHSSLSYMNDMRSTQHSSADMSSLHSSSTHIAATYTHPHVSAPKNKSCVARTYGGELQMVEDKQNRVSQNSLNDNTEAIQEIKQLNETNAAKTSDLDAEKNTAVPEPSPSSSHTQGKTSKTLSPDLLQLLKGKDANTVTNILRTLSPFYPALQDVNLEILSQVLVNTGALD